MKKYHYVYKITNLNPVDERKYYIGVRSSKVKPELDTNYRSSSNHLKVALKEIGHSNFHKEILSEWETRKLANKEEERLHELYNVSLNKEYYNKCKAKDNGFCTEGSVTVLDTRDGKNKQVSVEDFNKYDYYVHCTKGGITVKDTRDSITKHVPVSEYEKHDYYVSFQTGKVSVIDTRTGKTKQVSKQEFNDNDYYVRPNKGKVVVLDTRDGEHKLVSKTDFEKYDYYKHNTKDKVVVRDTRDGQTKQVSKDDFYKFDYYIRTNSMKIEVYKSDKTLFDVCYGNFVKFCSKHNLSSTEFTKSYNSGQPAFNNASTNTLRQLRKYDREFQIGWYALKV